MALQGPHHVAQSSTWGFLPAALAFAASALSTALRSSAPGLISVITKPAAAPEDAAAEPAGEAMASLPEPRQEGSARRRTRAGREDRMRAMVADSWRRCRTFRGDARSASQQPTRRTRLPV